MAATRDGLTVDAGIADLVVMKTIAIGVRGLPRDEFTTLAETEDRIMATKVTSTWRYEPSADIDFDAVVHGRDPDDARRVRGALQRVGPGIDLDHRPGDPRAPSGGRAEVTMTLPNLHHWPVDLERSAIPNDREVYVSTTEPHGLIQATVRRG